MSRVRVRFVIDVGDQLSELFSLTEKPDGTINLFWKHSHSYTLDRHAGTSEVVSQRTTLHTSEKSQNGGRTFMHTVELKDRRRIRSSAFVVPNSEGIVWLLKSVMSQDLNHARYAYRQKRSEKIVVLDRINTSRMTLIFHVVVSDNSFSYNIANINHVLQTFSKFNLSVYWLFLALGSGPLGRSSALGTSLITINGLYTQLDRFSFKGAISPNIFELCHRINAKNDEFRDEQVELRKRVLEMDGEAISKETEDTIITLSRVTMVRPPLDFSSKEPLPGTG